MEEELTRGFYFAQMPSLYIVQPPPLSQIKTPKKQITKERCRENDHGSRPHSQNKMTRIVELGFSKGMH